MIKHKSLQKNSFTLFETLLSITILIIVVSGFYNSTYSQKNSDKNFQLLNKLENDFDTKDYSKLSLTNENLQITINKSEIKNILVKKYEYLNENIKIYKYEK